MISQIKRMCIAIVLFTGLYTVSNAQNMRFNAYTNYVFDDNHVDSYFDNSNYYRGEIKGGFQWGAGLEYLVSDNRSVELQYLRQDCIAPMEYFSNGIKYNDFKLGMNYIMLVGNNYFQGNDMFEPYFGVGIGMAIINIKNPITTGDSTKEKLAWNAKLGTNIWLTEGIGIKLQAQLLSAVQSVGGGFYFGTGGPGVGVSTNSTLYQFELGGGLVFKLGK